MQSAGLTIGPEYTMDLILDVLRNMVDYELAVVMSIEDGSTLRVRKAKGVLYTPKLDDFELSLDFRKDLKKIIDNRETYLFKEDEKHIDTYSEILDMPDGHSCLVSPLYIQDTPIGVLTLDHRTCSMFDEALVKSISTLSGLLSVNLAQYHTNKVLYEQNKNLINERNNLLQDVNTSLKNVVGESERWKEVVNNIRLVAGADTPVLLQGETGTGKEVVARAIHNLSLRAQGPFVAINCSTLTESLMESELFGHEKGAFTGAVERKPGRFELAHSGTLFLDEIGELPLNLQPKLLRVIQEGEFERVGGVKTIKTDVRIIAATNINLQQAVEDKKFREDLFYRLNVFPVHLPPLRERGDDVVLLARYFLESIKKRYGIEKLDFSRESIEYLKTSPWPGNVRELQNKVERAVLLCRTDRIGIEHLSLPEGKKVPGRDITHGTAGFVPVKLDDVVREHIAKTLELTGGRIYGAGGAAEILGLKPSTLQSRMKKLGIERL